MKVAEVRTALKKYTKEELIEQYIAAYKEVPKAKRETDLDPLISEGIQKGTKTRKAKAETVDFKALSEEIETFLGNAENDLYYVPNRTVPKAKRSKWRFDVMRFYKELQKIPLGDPDYDASNDLLERLFRLLSEGCGYYKFNTDDPFASIQVEQYDFYEVVAHRKLSADHSPMTVRDLCDLAVSVYLSRDTLHTYFYDRLASELAATDSMETALAAIQALVEKYKKELPAKSSWSTSYFEKQRRIDESGELYMVLCCITGREEEGAAYWKSISTEKNKEVLLYCILDIAATFGSSKAWIRIYDRAVKDGVKPRDVLQEQYRKTKESLEQASEETEE